MRTFAKFSPKERSIRVSRGRGSVAAESKIRIFAKSKPTADPEEPRVAASPTWAAAPRSGPTGFAGTVRLSGASGEHDLSKEAMIRFFGSQLMPRLYLPLRTSAVDGVLTE
jgi:hypothetical protein